MQSPERQQLSSPERVHSVDSTAAVAAHRRRTQWVSPYAPPNDGEGVSRRPPRLVRSPPRQDKVQLTSLHSRSSGVPCRYYDSDNAESRCSPSPRHSTHVGHLQAGGPSSGSRPRESSSSLLHGDSVQSPLSHHSHFATREEASTENSHVATATNMEADLIANRRQAYYASHSPTVGSVSSPTEDQRGASNHQLLDHPSQWSHPRERAPSAASEKPNPTFYRDFGRDSSTPSGEQRPSRTRGSAQSSTRDVIHDSVAVEGDGVPTGGAAPRQDKLAVRGSTVVATTWITPENCHPAPGLQQPSKQSQEKPHHDAHQPRRPPAAQENRNFSTELSRRELMRAEDPLMKKSPPSTNEKAASVTTVTVHTTHQPLATRSTAGTHQHEDVHWQEPTAVHGQPLDQPEQQQHSATDAYKPRRTPPSQDTRNFSTELSQREMMRAQEPSQSPLVGDQCDAVAPPVSISLHGRSVIVHTNNVNQQRGEVGESDQKASTPAEGVYQPRRTPAADVGRSFGSEEARREMMRAHDSLMNHEAGQGTASDQSISMETTDDHRAPTKGSTPRGKLGASSTPRRLTSMPSNRSPPRQREQEVASPSPERRYRTRQYLVEDVAPIEPGEDDGTPVVYVPVGNAKLPARQFLVGVNDN